MGSTAAGAAVDQAAATVGFSTSRSAGALLRRRGWTAESLKIGDMVTIDGWPSRDGSRYLRVRRVVRSDGTVLGAPPNQRAD